MDDGGSCSWKSSKYVFQLHIHFRHGVIHVINSLLRGNLARRIKVEYRSVSCCLYFIASYSFFAAYDGGKLTECSIWLRIILTYGACTDREIYFSNPASPLFASSFFPVKLAEFISNLSKISIRS